MASGADDAAWLAGWSTLALAVLAIATAIVATVALFKQNRQLAILKGAGRRRAPGQHQAARSFRSTNGGFVFAAELIELREAPKLRERDARERQAIEERRAEEDKVIRGVTYTWHKGSAPWDDFDRLGDLMPDGGEATRVRSLPDDLPGYVNPEGFGAVAYFTDAAGANWRVRHDGELHEIPVGQPMP